MSAPMWAAASPSRPAGAAAAPGAPPGAPPPPPPPPPSGFGGITVAGPAGGHARAGSTGFNGGAPPPPPPVAAAAPAPAPVAAAEPAAAPKPAFKPPPPIASIAPQAAAAPAQSQRSMSTALPSPTQSYATAPAPLSTREGSSSMSSGSTPTHTRAPSSSVAPVDKTGQSPPLIQAKKDLNDVLDAGRASYNNNRELQTKKDKLDPDGRLTSMVNRLWYRFAFLINAKYLGAGSDLAKEAIMLLTVLCEVRQTVVDVFEYSKSMGDKVSIILTRHAWLFETARRMEELVERVSIKISAVEGKDKGTKATTYVPQLLDAPLALFEDRLANYTYEQQQALFNECGNLKSLRSQVESYLAMNYEVGLISLFITEAVGKAVGVLLPQKERRKLYFSSLLSTYSVCRANSWMLLKANHMIDLSKTLSKLNIAKDVATPIAGAKPAESAPGMPSVGAADLMRQQTVTSTSVRALPTEEVLRVMMDGIVLTGYFAVPNIEEPIVQRMAVWYDLVEGSANKIAANLTGKKGALFWAPERAARTKSADCALPISDITDILLGKQTKVFQTVVGSKANPGCCVTLVAKGGYSMNFEAASKEALTQWMSGLTKLANASGKKMYEAADKEQEEAAAAATALLAQAPQAKAEPVFAPISTTGPPPLLSASASAYTGSPQVGAAATPAAAPSALAFPGGADEEEVLAPASVAPVVAPVVSANPPALLSSSSSYTNSAAAGLVNGGWVRCAAPDGNFYFYHAGRGESVWVQPPEYLGEPQTGPQIVQLEY